MRPLHPVQQAPLPSRQVDPSAAKRTETANDGYEIMSGASLIFCLSFKSHAWALLACCAEYRMIREMKAPKLRLFSLGGCTTFCPHSSAGRQTRPSADNER